MYGHYFVSLVGFLSCIIFVLRLLHVQHHPRVMVVVYKSVQVYYTTFNTTLFSQDELCFVVVD